jgi:C1A family cysteine protease
MIRYARKYGWVPDVPDQRDYLYSAIQPVVRLPKVVDLRNDCSEIEYQGRLGSCTAQALAGNLEFLDRKVDDKYTDVSRLFIYYNERKLMNSVYYDSGATLRDGIKTLRNDGACHEVTWPYDIYKFDVKPPVRCYTEAKKHLISSYYRLTTIRELLTCLADGYPFVFGFAVYESFDSAKVRMTGKVNMPKKDEKQVGGHAVMAVGYDQDLKRFIVRNSWGKAWGREGYFTMPFKYVETLADDFWTIRR